MSNFLSSDWFKSTAALVIGWLLSEVSHYLLTRRERRKAISSALADLFEIRNQFVAFNLAVREIKKIIPAEALPANAEPQLRALIAQYANQLFPRLREVSQEISARFNESVTLVASIDPILGYQLRSKDLVQQVFDTLNSLFAQDALAAQLWQEVSGEILEGMTKELDAQIKGLAWKLGPVSRYKATRVLSRGREIPDTASKLLGVARKGVELSSKGASQPPTESKGNEAAKGAGS